MSESNRIEYKRELTKDLDLEKEVIAFLNYHEGGIIFIGIDKEGFVSGVEDVDSDMLKIKDRLKNNILPSCLGLFDVRAEKRGELSLVKITIASGPEKPYFKRIYGRQSSFRGKNKRTCRPPGARTAYRHGSRHAELADIQFCGGLVVAFEKYIVRLEGGEREEGERVGRR